MKNELGKSYFRTKKVFDRGGWSRGGRREERGGRREEGGGRGRRKREEEEGGRGTPRLFAALLQPNHRWLSVDAITRQFSTLGLSSSDTEFPHRTRQQRPCSSGFGALDRDLFAVHTVCIAVCGDFILSGVLPCSFLLPQLLPVLRVHGYGDGLLLWSGLPWL